MSDKKVNETNTMNVLSSGNDTDNNDTDNNGTGNNDTSGGTGTSTANFSSGGGGAVQTPAAPQTAPSPTQVQKPSSGMFTNIRSYLQANQDGGSRVAGAVQGNIQNQAQQGQARLGTVASEFQQKMDQASGRAATEEGRQQAIQDVTAFAQREGGVDPQAQMTEGFGEQDFTNILNKQYQGIERADQTQSFADAQKFYDRLQRSIAAAQDPTQTGSVLKDTFGRQAPYTRGMSSLDSAFYNASDEARAIRSGEEFQSMLNVPQEAMSGLRDQTQEMLNARRQAIQDMVNQAQTGFSDVATGRAGAIEDRLTGVEQNWHNLARYFRDRLGGQTGDIGLTEDEARILGITTGDQFFNLTGEDQIKDFIRSREFDRQRLISQDEQANLARLQALSEMAGLQGDRAFSTDYGADLAGSMTALDALDTENVREQLNQAMENFRQQALQQQTGAGWGHDRYKDWKGKSKDILEHRTATGALDDVLSDAGYQYQQAGADITGDIDFLKSIAARNAAGPGYDGDLRDYDLLQFGSTDNVFTGDKGILNPSDPLGNVGTLAGSAVSTVGNVVSEIGGALAPGFIGDNLLSSTVGQIGNLMSSLGRRFGSDRSAKQAGAAARAQDMANQNLVNALTNQLNQSGFANIANVGVQDDVRKEALLALIDQLDHTNLRK